MRTYVCMPSSKKETDHLPPTTDLSPSLLFPVKSWNIYLVTLCQTLRSSRFCLIFNMVFVNIIRVKPNYSSPLKISLATLITASKAILPCWTLLKPLIPSTPTPFAKATPLRHTKYNQQVDSSLGLL